MLSVPLLKPLTLKHHYKPTRRLSSSDWYEETVSVSSYGLHAYAHFQERELEKVNAFYLQKEAEVCPTVTTEMSLAHHS